MALALILERGACDQCSSSTGGNRNRASIEWNFARSDQTIRHYPPSPPGNCPQAGRVPVTVMAITYTRQAKRTSYIVAAGGAPKGRE